jgi:uncharacterized protein GlcG (DUF336 family)
VRGWGALISKLTRHVHHVPSTSLQRIWQNTLSPVANSSEFHVSNLGRIMIFAGGIPLRRDGKVVGAVGVSGGSGEQDHAVAEAGAAAVLNRELLMLVVG